MTEFRLPSYDELPAAPGGGRSAWGLFGDDDNVGLFNLVTEEVTRAALALAKRGAVFSHAPISSHSFSVDDLEAARAAAGIEFRRGDVLLLRTGFMSRYADLPASERERISTREGLAACDCPALEVWPFDDSPEA